MRHMRSHCPALGNPWSRPRNASSSKIPGQKEITKSSNGNPSWPRSTGNGFSSTGNADSVSFTHPIARAAVTDATNETMRCRCLSGCGHATWISQPDATRDGRIVRLQCREGIDIFVGEQTWRAGISRISYRHDGNYVILGADGKLVGEGRVEVSPPRTLDTIILNESFNWDQLRSSGLA